MLPENMPEYCSPTMRSCLNDKTFQYVKLVCLSNADVDPAISPLLTTITPDAYGGHHFCLQRVPLLTGILSPTDIIKCTKSMYHSYGTTIAA